MKRVFILIILGLFACFANSAFAVSFNATVTPTNANMNDVASVKFNFTVNDTNNTVNANNITEVIISWPSGLTYIENSDWKSVNSDRLLTGAAIVNTTARTISWINSSSNGTIWSPYQEYFSFNVSGIGSYNFNVSVRDSYGILNSTNVSVNISGVVITGLPTTREFGSSSVNITCSGYSNVTSGNISNLTIRISNLTYFDQTSGPGSWNTPVWSNTFTRVNVTGIQNSSIMNFTLLGNYSDLYKYVARCEANDTGGATYRSSNYSFIVSLRNFSGFVKNSTGSNLPVANVSIYRFEQVINGPPTETLVSSALTGPDGNFTLTNVNTSRMCTPNGAYPNDVSNPTTCEPQFRIKVVYPNESSATQTGPTLPPFPRQMIFGFDGPTECPPGAPAGMKCGPPKLNGSTIYTQAAAIINLTASNLTGDSINFGYEVMDKSQGFPIISCMNCDVSGEAHVIVPTGRNYTVMIARNPDTYPPPENNWTLCFNFTTQSSILTQLNCPSPPRSNSSISPSTAGEIININQNLSYSEYYLTGYINVTGNLSCPVNATTFPNITSILPKMIPWEGFVPPTKAIIQEFNVSNDIVYGSFGSDRIASYTLRVIGAASPGINYFVEIYGDCSGEYFAAFQNVSITANKSLNVTMRKLVGAYDASGDVNTSKITINLFKNSGNKTNCNAADTGGTVNCQALSQPHLEIEVRHSSVYGGQSIKYMLDSLSNGSFKMPFLSGSTVKLTIFEQGTSPLVKTVSLSQNVTNITVFPFMPDKINSDGSKTALNKTGNEGSAQIIRFYRNSDECNVYNPPESCALEGGNFSVSEFNPMSAMMAGKVNMRLISSNVTLYFLNVDLMASGPPEPEKSESALSGGVDNSSNLQKAWKFGSMAPRIYDQVFIGMKDSSLNSSWSYNMSIPVLYGENISATPPWNLSAGNSTSDLPEDYVTYNGSQYQSFLTTTGKPCSVSNTSSECYFDNSTNKTMWIKIPHFSGVQPTMSGSAPASAAIPTPTTISGGGGGGSSGSSSSATVSLKRGNANITVPSIAAGKMANVSIAKYQDIAFRQINISVSNSVNNIKIIITKLAGSPASVTHTIEGKVYHYIEVDKINFTDSNISKIFIKFAVNKTWFTDNGVDKTNISLYRWVNYKWIELPTTFISNDSSETFYQAESPGLSYFLIGTKDGDATVAPAPSGAAVACTENWSCTDWSACVNETQTRTCTDANSCGTTSSKPTESEQCEMQANTNPATTNISWIYYTVAAAIVIIVLLSIFIFRDKITSAFSKSKSTKD